MIKIKKSSKMSTIKEDYIDENKLQDDAEVLEKFLSMKDAIANTQPQSCRLKLCQLLQPYKTITNNS